MWDSLFATSGWLTIFLLLLLPISIVMATLVGRVSPPIAYFSAATAMASVVFLILLGMRTPLPPPPSFLGWSSILIFMLVSYRVSFWSVFEVGGDYRCLLSNNLGDSCLHLALINAIAHSGDFWPFSPWFSSERMSYPPGLDMIDSLLVSSGHGLGESMRLTTFLVSCLTAMLLWAWGRSWAVVVFLVSGSLFPLLNHLQIDLGFSEVWKNLYLNVFSSQRGMQLALPSGLLLLISCRRFVESGLSRYFVLASLIYAFLPLASVHSTVALFPVMLLTFVWGELRKTLIPFVSALLASAIGFWYIGVFGKISSLRISSFLPLAEVASPASWVLNYGFWLLLIVWISFLLIIEERSSLPNFFKLRLGQRTATNWEKVVFLSFVAVFAVSNVVMFSPWSWDNTKIMLWSVVGTSGFIGSCFLRKTSLAKKAVLLALVVLPSSPYLLKEISVHNTGHRLFRSEEYREALSARQTFGSLRNLAASPEYNHPWLIAGHSFVVGYEGWLWSHALNYKDHHAKLSRIIKGDPDWESLSRDLDIDYLLWGPREKLISGRQSHPVETEWRECFRGNSGVLYRRD